MKTIPYYERIMETLSPLNPQPMKTYQGENLAELERIEVELMTHPKFNTRFARAMYFPKDFARNQEV